jgi:hypothetical protein
MGIFIGLLYFQTPLSVVGINNLNGGMFYIIGSFAVSIELLYSNCLITYFSRIDLLHALRNSDLSAG